MYTEEFLRSLIIDKIEENLNLDYKAAGALERSDAKTKEISKDVSAFANSAGGIIIYGLKDDTENKHLASEIDPIERSGISKEWLEQIIQTHIQPRINNVTIHPIEIGGGLSKVVYVVNIPKSTTRPTRQTIKGTTSGLTSYQRQCMTTRFETFLTE